MFDTADIMKLLQSGGLGAAAGAGAEGGGPGALSGIGGPMMGMGGTEQPPPQIDQSMFPGAGGGPQAPFSATPPANGNPSVSNASEPGGFMSRLGKGFQDPALQKQMGKDIGAALKPQGSGSAPTPPGMGALPQNGQGAMGQSGMQSLMGRMGPGVSQVASAGAPFASLPQRRPMG